MSNYYSNHASLQNVQANKFRENSLYSHCYGKDFPSCKSTQCCLLCPMLFWPFFVKSSCGPLKINTLACRLFFFYLIATRPIGCNSTKTLCLLSLCPLPGLNRPQNQGASMELAWWENPLHVQISGKHLHHNIDLTSENIYVYISVHMCV